MKRETVADMPKYVKKDPRIPLLLKRLRFTGNIEVVDIVDRMKDSGATVFLATNSDYHYTQSVMTFLFDVPLPEVRSMGCISENSIPSGHGEARLEDLL
jgi:5'-nucleotidase